MDNPAIKFSDVSKSLNFKQILSNIQFQAYAKQISALLGPNGAGKTTSLRILMGMMMPDSGSVEVLGHSIWNDAAHIRQMIGFLPQENSGYKLLSAYENVEFMMKLKGLSKFEWEDEFFKICGQLNLEASIHKKWGVLSGGEKRAFGLARAILPNPEILVLDEPTAGLDLERSVAVRKLIQQQADKGKTILLSSHILTDIEELASRIIIITSGKIVSEGTKEDTITRYAPTGELNEALITAFRSHEHVETIATTDY